MHPREFVLLTGSGSHGVGTFPYHTWHKRPGENILKELGIEVEHSDEVVESVEDNRVGDLKHIQMVELRSQGESYNKIANQLGVSSQTTHNHIDMHNKDLASKGYCVRCKRGKSPLQNQRLD